MMNCTEVENGSMQWRTERWKLMKVINMIFAKTIRKKHRSNSPLSMHSISKSHNWKWSWQPRFMKWLKMIEERTEMIKIGVQIYMMTFMNLMKPMNRVIKSTMMTLISLFVEATLRKMTRFKLSVKKLDLAKRQVLSKSPAGRLAQSKMAKSTKTASQWMVISKSNNWRTIWLPFWKIKRTRYEIIPLVKATDY